MSAAAATISNAVHLPSAAAQIGAGVAGSLSYIVPTGEKPMFQSAALAGGAGRFFFETEQHEVPIADMRPLADELSIDREGFELLHRPTAVADLYDDDQIAEAYEDEIKALLKARFGADRVVVFDATRRSDGVGGAANPDGQRGPANRIHVDYTAKSGPQRTRDLLGEEEAARLLAKGARILQVNVWRPIRGPVRRSPLALADASSVETEDLVATDQVFPDRVGEIYHLAYNPAQHWYYAPEMSRDEVLLIKGWDSRDDGRARFTPHSAFSLPDEEDAAPRESIEVRTLVVIE